MKNIDDQIRTILQGQAHETVSEPLKYPFERDLEMNISEIRYALRSAIETNSVTSELLKKVVNLRLRFWMHETLDKIVSMKYGSDTLQIIHDFFRAIVHSHTSITDIHFPKKIAQATDNELEALAYYFTQLVQASGTFEETLIYFQEIRMGAKDKKSI